KDGIVDQWMAKFKDDEAGLVRAAFVRTLCREPTAAEQTAIVNELNVAKADSNNPATYREAIEDFVWSLMSSREFLFNY
ncbi:MAG: S-layer protein, partial [Bacteroidota bacterium]